MPSKQIDLKERFYIFDNFITSNKHILERGDDEWNTSKIFFQLSIEHADNSPLTHGAEKYEREGKLDFDYVRDTNRRKKYIFNSFRDLISFKKNIKSIELKENTLIVCLEDIVIIFTRQNFQKIDEYKLERVQTKPLMKHKILDTVETNNSYYNLKNGDLFCYGNILDRDVIIRDAKTLEQKAIIEGHGGSPVHLQELSNGDIATISYQRAFRILRAYKQIYKLDEVHNDEVLGFIYDETNNELITYSKDKTVRKFKIDLKYNPSEQANLKNLSLCNDFKDCVLISGVFLNKISRVDYKLIQMNKEHQAPVTSIAKIDDRYFATASMDQSIKIFDIKTFESVLTLEFKEDRFIPIIKCVEIEDNKKLIYAVYGKTAYIINNELEYKKVNKDDYKEYIKNTIEKLEIIRTNELDCKGVKWFSDKEKEIKFIDEKNNVICIKDGKKSLKFLKLIPSFQRW